MKTQIVCSKLSWGFLTLHKHNVTWNFAFQSNHDRPEVFVKTELLKRDCMLSFGWSAKINYLQFTNVHFN